MKKNNSCGVFPKLFLFGAILLTASGLFFACASSKVHHTGQEQEYEFEYLFEVKSPQEVIYNGLPHAISYIYTGTEKPDIIYYTSSMDQAEDRRGSRTDPTDSGTYYVRLIRPGTGKNTPAKEFYAIFIILKRPVNIEAEESQFAVFNGDPKRIRASAIPNVALSFSYYPNMELLETAKKSAANNPPGQSTFTRTFAGYRRIDRAPSEQGTYYVWIYYPGDKNNESASLDVEFTILPPRE